jgi:tetratricopeptide (TPR) repeat protein
MFDGRRGRRLPFFLVLTLLLLIPLIAFLSPRFEAELQLSRGRRAAAAGDHPEAMLRLAAAAKALEDGGGLWEEVAGQALAGGDRKNARAYLENARSAGTLSSQGSLLLGDLRAEAGDLPGAVQAWQAARMAGGPALELEALNRLIEAHVSLGDLEAEAEARKALLARQPADARLALEIGLLTAASSPQEALAYLTQAADQDPDLAGTARTLIQVIRRASLVSEDPAYQLTEVGRTLAGTSRWAHAAAAFANATQLNPSYPAAWAYLAEAVQRNGGDGRPALEQAYRLDPASVVVNTFYALYWQRQGQPALALEHLEAALEADPQNPTLLAELAAATTAVGDVQSGLNLFIQAVNQAPDDPRYWRLLAGYSIRHEVQVAEIGLPAARQAMLMAPDDPQALDLIGQAYMILQDPLLAERFFLRALSQDPTYAPAALHMGILYLGTGQMRSARARLEQVVDMSPDSSSAQQAALLLETYFP